MRRIALLLGCLLVAPFGANAQLAMNTGDTYVYHFDDLPLINSSPFISPPEGAEVMLFFSGGGFESYKLELFEGLPEGEPVIQGSGQINLPLALNKTGTWADREGSIRITALGGSFTLNSIRISRFDPNVAQSTIDRYGVEFSPVPEPSTLAVSFLGVAALLFWKRK